MRSIKKGVWARWAKTFRWAVYGGPMKQKARWCPTGPFAFLAVDGRATRFGLTASLAGDQLRRACRPCRRPGLSITPTE